MLSVEEIIPYKVGDAPHADRAHSKISPSKLKALELCPRWLPDNKEAHVVTQAGTKMHEALDSGNFDALSEEERLLASLCLAYTQALKDQIKGCVILREERLEIIDGIWGFADLILFSPDKSFAELVDYKFAFNLQEPADTNPAAQAYALGMFRRYEKLQTIGVHYLYPRLDHVSYAIYRRTDLPRLELRVRTIAARVEDPSSKPFPEPSNCLYCGRQSTCEALHKTILPIATRYHDNKPVQIPAVPDFSLVKDPGQWGVLMQWAPLLEATADSIKRHALDFRLEHGGEIPGYELRSRSGKKRIVNAPMAWEEAKKLGVSQEEFLRCVDVRASDLADAAAEHAPRGKKGSVKQTLEDALRDAGALEIGPDTHFLQKARKTTDKQLD